MSGIVRANAGKLRTFLVVMGAVWLLANSARGQNTPLPGTEPLTLDGDLASRMIDGIDRFLLREIDASVAKRAALWNRDPSSAANYEKSIAPNRARFAKIIGAQGPRVEFDDPELVDTTSRSALVGRGVNYDVYAVRWPVLPGIFGEGLLLNPAPNTQADVIAIPDADQSPEMLAGLVPGIAGESQFARYLAERGCRVLVPTLIDRGTSFSQTQNGARKLNLTHREFLYRAAYEMGRHIIGYEVQTILAGVDWFSRDSDKKSGKKNRKIGVAGYGEGGLLALYAAALDTRIDAALVSGYFTSRQNVWTEPIDRNVFGLLHEFGDAELATLIAPRKLIVEAARGPAFEIPPGTPGGPGALISPALATVKTELDRARSLVGTLPATSPFELVVSENGDGPFGTKDALEKFMSALSVDPGAVAKRNKPEHLRPDFDPQQRMRRLVAQIDRYNQDLLRESPYVREQFQARLDRKSRSIEKFEKSARWYRQYFYDEVIGRFDRDRLPFKPRTRQIYEEPTYRGYEVVLDVFPDVFAYGILLVPKDIGPNERRPVVVCQHGLEGRPQDVADPKVDNHYYHRFACRLAERGFVTYAPQNPYIFADRFRTLQRKANPIKKTLFSIIVPQHRQTVDWLASLPFVDPGRIAFYGLSYGGKTAMRVPPLVDRYCLSICSGDFDDWIWKNVSTRSRYTYVSTGEYEMFEFDLGHTFNYSDLAALIAPRPFMVERGHRDGVGPDYEVASEFAKVRLLYADLKIPDRTEIEFFDGPHTIHGQGTFDFLHKHLNWPAVNHR